jgi:hypothetical protein
LKNENKILSEIIGEALMLRTVVVAIIAALPLLFSAGEVRAKSMGINGVECPVGTCNPMGGPKAKDVKYCRPANCKKDAPK